MKLPHIAASFWRDHLRTISIVVPSMGSAKRQAASLSHKNPVENISGSTMMSTSPGSADSSLSTALRLLAGSPHTMSCCSADAFSDSLIIFVGGYEFLGIFGVKFTVELFYGFHVVVDIAGESEFGCYFNFFQFVIDGSEK